MFTGLVREVGEVTSFEGGRLVVDSATPAEVGDSICVGSVAAVEPERDGVRIRIEPPAGLLRYLVEKGSIALEGVSLTVAAVDDAAFEIALIPHTLAETTLSRLAPGDSVNLEADVLAKYVERLLPRTGGE